MNTNISTLLLLICCTFPRQEIKAATIAENDCIACNEDIGLCEQTTDEHTIHKDAKANDHCIPYVLFNNCVEISIEEEYPELEKQFSFEWDFGDGNILKGKTVTHCYGKPGTYVISMNMIDEVTGIVLEEEWFGEVEIAEGLRPYITGPSRVTTGMRANYGYTLDLPEGYKVGKVMWEFDGQQTEGHSLETSTDKIGTYNLSLEIELLHNEELLTVCTTAEIIVEKFNIDGKAITEKFRKAIPSGFHTGRFLDDALMLGMLNFSNGRWKEMVLGEKKHHIPVEGDNSYRVIFWKGNQFTKFIGLETEGLSDSAAFRKLCSLVGGLKPSEIHFLPSLYFDMESEEASASDLANHIELLRKCPYLMVDIGVHTHHQGSMEKVRKYADRRATSLETALLSNGIDSAMVRKHSPYENLALLNNCEGVINCRGSDERLSRRADFKVTAIDYERYLIQ